MTAFPATGPLQPWLQPTFPVEPDLAERRTVQGMPETLRQLLWRAVALLKPARITVRGVDRHAYDLCLFISQDDQQSQVWLYFDKHMVWTKVTARVPQCPLTQDALECLRAALEPKDLPFFPVFNPSTPALPPTSKSMLDFPTSRPQTRTICPLPMQASQTVLKQVAVFDHLVRRCLRAPAGQFPATAVQALPLPGEDSSSAAALGAEAQLPQLPDGQILPLAHQQALARAKGQLEPAGIAVAPGKAFAHGLRLHLLREGLEGTIVVYFKGTGAWSGAVTEGGLCRLAVEAVEILKSPLPDVDAGQKPEFPQDTPLFLLSAFYHLADRAGHWAWTLPRVTLRAGTLTVWFEKAQGRRLELALHFGPGDAPLRLQHVRYQCPAMLAQLQEALEGIYCTI
jgi:hypothetical protein